MERRPMVRKMDFLVLAVVLFLAGGAWLWVNHFREPQGVYAVVQVAGEQVLVLSLNQEQEIALPECPDVVVLVEDGKAGFVYSDCPDQTCVRTGMLSVPGTSAVCLPNRVVLRIAGEETDTLPDAVVH